MFVTAKSAFVFMGFTVSVGLSDGRKQLSYLAIFNAFYVRNEDEN